jgi:hypothetical protein
VPWPRDRVREETEIEGPLCKCQQDRGKVGRALYRYFKLSGSPAQNGHRERVRVRVLPVSGPTWTIFSPVLFIVSLFLFLLDIENFRRIVEKC